ncbi:hypothetical protein NE237_027204 [Protea cynaroides]|uniref:Glucose/Sorbosone dehydrogenase domain-containing protein n=1 Tax=Protea cynaroides TaxID=273540 RepID=A0A9Q0JSY9_9MAGN|nr:hypothetical protein NE237_027204 [Protea cynaroides]
MVGHPDGSNRVFISDREGRIRLATVPAVGSGGTLGPDKLSLFLDISDKVYVNYDLGLMGMAFHPNFMQNGCFFVSFNHDKIKWDGCSGKCSCNSDVNGDPSVFNSTFGLSPCQYYAVISEFTANETKSGYSLVCFLTLVMGSDSLWMGDGVGVGDPYNFSQNKKSLLGKIMRLDADDIPSATQINELGLWGNYSTPEDNPVSEDYGLWPEIWALGLKNPWHCDFDPKRPSYFLCADNGARFADFFSSTCLDMI